MRAAVGQDTATPQMQHLRLYTTVNMRYMRHAAAKMVVRSCCSTVHWISDALIETHDLLPCRALDSGAVPAEAYGAS